MKDAYVKCATCKGSGKVINEKKEEMRPKTPTSASDTQKETHSRAQSYGSRSKSAPTKTKPQFKGSKKRP